MEKRQSMQKKAIVQECEKYKAQLEKSGTKYKILSENMILLEKMVYPINVDTTKRMMKLMNWSGCAGRTFD